MARPALPVIGGSNGVWDTELNAVLADAQASLDIGSAAIATLQSDVAGLAMAGALPSVPNLHAHWDAGSLGLADGARVSSWLDEVAGRNAAQATSGNQPLYVANAINGRPGVLFDTTRPDYLQVTIAPGTAAATIIVVMTAKDVASGSKYVLGTNGGPRNIYRGILGDVGIQGVSVLQTRGVANAPEIVSGVYNDTSSAIRVNGAVTSGTSGANGTAPTLLTLGHRNSLAANNGFDGTICEVLYYARVLSAGECESIERHLGVKYGVGSAAQAQFYVNTVTGSDSNTGRTASAPIKTWKRLTDGINAASASVNEFSVAITAPESAPLRPGPITARNIFAMGKTVRLAPTMPGERWYLYGSEKISGGWTSLGGGIYSHALTRSAASGLICWTPDLLDGDGNPLRCMTNATVQTAPAAGEYGWASNVYYVHFIGDINPNSYDVEVADAGNAITQSVIAGSLTVEDATIRGNMSSGLYSVTGDVVATRVYAELCASSGFAIASELGSMQCRECVARYNGNDGYNLHGNASVNNLMVLMDCEGAWNGDEGASPHDDTIMTIQGGRYHHNGSGGVTAVNNAVVTFVGDEGDPVKVYNNRELYIAAPGDGDRGGVVLLDAVVANVYALHCYDNPGPGVSRASTTTLNIPGTLTSGTAEGNGTADEVV